MGYGALVDAGDDEAGDVGNVADVIGTDVFGDLAEGLEIDCAGIGCGA